MITNKTETMQDQNFTTTFLVKAAPGEVFEIIRDVSQWWTGEPGVEGRYSKVGDEFSYRYKDVHYSKQRVAELVPEKKIVWLVTDSRLNFIKQKDEWTGTRICFEISTIENKTKVRFIHSGLAPEIECYTDCSNAWSFYINESLRKLIEAKEVS